MGKKYSGRKDKRVLISHNVAKHLRSVYDGYTFVDNDEQSLW